MKTKIVVFFLFLLILTPTANLIFASSAQVAKEPSDLYFGVDVAFESLEETLRIIDEVSSYTNLFIIGCYGPVINSSTNHPVYNETRLSVISQYAYEKGLSLIVYSDDPRYPSVEWINKAKSDFGSKFLGIYYYDEPGGKQLDQANYPAFYYAQNFSDAANRYVKTVNWWLRSGPFSISKIIGDMSEIKLFTSDYGLYWFDYEAGYDTVFAEYGWNSGWEDYSRQLNAALVRGAATAMNKDWGIMITHAYQEPPFMESGADLYTDMTSAYANGAKYIIIFDSNKDWTQNILQQEHFDAMKKFWQYVKDNPRTTIPVSDRSAFVLPENYGEGFRSPEDTIWGLWHPDYNVEEGSQNFTSYIKMSVAAFLQILGPNLDIVYPRANQNIESIGYNKVVYWDDPALNPYGPTIPTQKPSGDETAWQLRTPTPSNPPATDLFPIGAYALGIGFLITCVVVISVRKLRKTPSHTPKAPETKTPF